MKYTKVTDRVKGRGAAAWAVHAAALQAQSEGADVVVMSVGDSAFDTPQPVIDAAVSALRSGDTHYTPVTGRTSLRQKVASHLGQTDGIQAAVENVTIVAGTQNALFLSAQLLIEQGDDVLVLDPMYVTYEAALGITGASLVPVPCPARLGFLPDLEEMRKLITSRTKAIFLATPVNPTGLVIDRKTLEEIAEIAKEHDLWVVSDEVYKNTIFEGAHCSIAALEGMAERTITLGSLSKSHSMTGWRVGWAVGPEEFSAHAEKMNLCMTYGLPGFIQAAAEVALDEDVSVFTNDFKVHRDLAVQSLSGVPELEVVVPQAGMFMMLDIRQTGMSGPTFVEALYQDQGVSLLDGGAFGASTEGFVRLSFAMSKKDILEGCRRIRLFCEKNPSNKEELR